MSQEKLILPAIKKQIMNPGKKDRSGIFRWKKWKIVVGVLLLWVFVHCLWVTIDGLNDHVEKGGVAVVLGNHVYADGTLATWTQGRVDRALALYKARQVDKIFVSGGISKNSHYPEGTAMKKYLVDHGVPDSAVISDNQGINSYHTAINFLEWNKSHHYGSVVVVSQFYHITRCKYIIRKMGFKGEIEQASSDRYNIKDLIGLLREMPAFYKYMIVY